MKALTAYLTFDGNTRDAMTFYRQCLGGELSMQTFKEAMPGGPKEIDDKIIHARLEHGGVTIMASDPAPGTSVRQGNNFSLCIDCDDNEEFEKLFGLLGAGGTVTMKPQDTFWGARFGMLTDRFGVGWMVNAEIPKKGQGG